MQFVAVIERLFGLVQRRRGRALLRDSCTSGKHQLVSINWVRLLNRFTRFRYALILPTALWDSVLMYPRAPAALRPPGSAILGVDIDTSGERLATCGSDNKIRIWSLRPIASEAAELDSSMPRQLAALGESTTPVNCVRFAPAGQLLAAGSDDSDGYVFELRDGRGVSVFGSGEAANIENWRLRLRLRGHETNVSDLSWAPDSRRLATASVDNRIKVRGCRLAGGWEGD